MDTDPRVRGMADIPGWFNPADRLLFEFFLSVAETPNGDLVELGTYLGKSTVHLGAFLRPGETFTVCDLFGAEAEDASNTSENSRSYESLDRASFEDNYQAVRGVLPRVVQEPSSTILDHVAAGSTRFVHIDASHLYDQVATDIDSAEAMLKPGGVVVFDDYRSPHTPGVAAAVWGALAHGRITPVCLSRSKFYAVFGSENPYRDQLLRWLQSQSTLTWQIQRIAGSDVVVRVRKS